VPHEVAETAANMVKDVGFSFPVEAV
jgi:hypothetical protein